MTASMLQAQLNWWYIFFSSLKCIRSPKQTNRRERPKPGKSHTDARCWWKLRSMLICLNGVAIEERNFITFDTWRMRFIKFRFSFALNVTISFIWYAIVTMFSIYIYIINYTLLHQMYQLFLTVFRVLFSFFLQFCQFLITVAVVVAQCIYIIYI